MLGPDELRALFKQHADKFGRLGMQQFLSACTELQGPSPISSPTRELGMPHTNVWPALQTNGKTAQEKRELQVSPQCCQLLLTAAEPLARR